MTYCAYCKGRVLDGDSKCPHCGSTVFIREPVAVPVPPVQPIQPVQVVQPVVYQTIEKRIYVRREVSDQNRWIALLLCLLGGVIGLHRFYTRKIGSGVLYLFTGGLFGIGAVVDFIVILCGGFRDRDGLPLAS